MSLLNRRPISIGREQREFRDDRVFVVATDDTFAPEQYFKHLALRRVRVLVLPADRDGAAVEKTPWAIATAGSVWVG